MSKPILRIDWATYEAAKYACENWHYSKCLPVGKLTKIGVWEHEKFVGVVIFSRGANKNMLLAYGLSQDEGCELTRIALHRHVNPVSRIVSIALKFLKKMQPKLRLVVSYADPEAGHHGGIYQAGNWIYTGTGSKSVKVFYRGKWSHKKTVDDAGINQENLRKKTVAGKHRYLMVLDDKMRKAVLSLRKEFPKRPKQAMTGVQPEQRWGSTNPDAPNSSGAANG